MFRSTEQAAKSNGDKLTRTGNIGVGVLRWMARFVRAYPCRRLRCSLARGRARWVKLLPAGARKALDLTGGLVSPLRVELGGGPFPTPGYIHVDADRRARHLEHVAPAWDLPFVDGSVQELLAIHVLEHVHPADVDRTMREWHRVLASGRAAQIHVPNAGAVLPAFVEGDTSMKWALMASAIFGMGSGPSVAAPADLDARANVGDHKALYDFALLQDRLLAAGFARVDDVSDQVIDRHTEAWAPMVPRFSLVVRATA